MKLIITDSIKKTEFLPQEKKFSFEVVKTAAQKCFDGIGLTIKGVKKIPKSLLKKVSLTGSGGAGRVLFLMQVSSKKAVLIMIRSKNDKNIGENMSMSNPKFKKVLEKNLDVAIQDVLDQNYEEYDLQK